MPYSDAVTKLESTLFSLSLIKLLLISYLLLLFWFANLPIRATLAHSDSMYVSNWPTWRRKLDTPVSSQAKDACKTSLSRHKYNTLFYFVIFWNVFTSMVRESHAIIISYGPITLREKQSNHSDQIKKLGPQNCRILIKHWH